MILWDDERARELEAHLAIETDDNIARGMTPGAARDAARRTLGNRTLAICRRFARPASSRPKRCAKIRIRCATMKLAGAIAAASILSAAQADTRATVDERVRKLTRDSSWQLSHPCRSRSRPIIPRAW